MNNFQIYKCYYIGWGELDDLAQNLWDDETIEVIRDDFYYVHVVSSGRCCDYDDEELIGRISNYLDVPLSSYHADENGVWFVGE